MFPPLLVGGPHLFSACVFVLLLKNATQSLPSNEKRRVASKVCAHFLNRSLKDVPIKNSVVSTPRRTKAELQERGSTSRRRFGNTARVA